MQKIDKYSISNTKLDRRVRLTLEDKAKIIKEYKQTRTTISDLARKWNVSRSTISYVLFPERYERAKERHEERRKDGRYYDKEKYKESLERHREYKRELLKNGELVSNKK